MSALAIDNSLEAARRATRIMLGDVPAGELVELSVRKKGKFRSVFAPLDEVLAVGGGVDALRRASAGGADAYAGMCSLRERPGAGRRGSSGLRVSAGSAWIDVDVAAPSREGPAYFASIDDAVAVMDQALEAVLPGLSGSVLVTSSGWGIQIFVPWAERMEARAASGLVKRLVDAVAEHTGGKRVDRLFDVSRLMRACGTYNWRAGGREQDAMITGVLRWPSAGPVAVEVLEAALPGAVVVAAAGAPWGGGRLNAAGGTGGALLDIESLCDMVLTWAQVLEPYGWTRVEERGIAGWAGGRELEIWSRPGGGTERSAVVYSGEPNLLTVYSDSPATGLGAGLRGAGARGDGAGVGVISKWRALVDLAHGGDRERAAEDVWEGGGPGGLGAALAEEWELSGEVVGEWADLARRTVHGPGAVAAQEELHARITAAKEEAERRG